MFAVFTPSGRVFSGSLEQLRRVEKTFKSNSIGQVDATHPGPGQVNIDSSPRGQNKPIAYKISLAKTQSYVALLSESKQREPIYHAYQIMNQNVQVIVESWTVAEAYKSFRTLPYHLFPIVDSGRNLLGSLSRKRFYEFLLTKQSSHTEIRRTIKDCFLDEDSLTYSAEPVTDVRRIIRLLIDKNLDSLTIVEEGGYIAGIVSRSDILKCTIAEPPLSLWC
ncbi:MAG: acetoin utilization protein AcuB [Gammaproteobacteria bacterium]|jgi:CBS domain-containing protein